ncbi:hypothetical protein N7495_003346 [Penicillium taxi]|uniref:uncharacterized protein n=1 Tax=Penicillium taxi TaxID=168475 RepID=UPI002544F267|nr:uncharacterized protein N7495_003346 [Penicillium taxi]KAJ5902818.1 hypothetical protein N7495_003346 [Penicillium taxi]
MFLRTIRARALRPTLLLRGGRFVSSAPLIQINNGTFYRQYPSESDNADNAPLYPGFNFSISSDRTPSELKHWAVIGPSGKTELLNILRGQYISVPPNARSYPYLRSDEIAAKDPNLRYTENAIQYIGFSGEGAGAIGGTRGAYLSARYESFREETDWSVEQYLRGQTSLNPLEGEENGTLKDEKLFQEVVAELYLSSLLDMPVANLSNGQTRRARIAKALLQKPELILLDEPFMGLDPATVRSLSELLHRLAAKCSPRIVLALRPQDTVPKWINHVLLVGNSHRVHMQGPRSELPRTLHVWRHLATTKAVKGLKSPEEKDIFRKAKSEVKSGELDIQLVEEFLTGHEHTPLSIPETVSDGEPLVEMDGVHVQYGDKAVLGHWTQTVDGVEKEGLHWMVRRGQRWAILGANGSGKTTLLSLITSDHPQTYALPIKLFGRSRLPEAGKPGVSIFELQSRLGHSSPEIHAFFPRRLTVRESLESAFAETFLSKPKLTYENDLDIDAVLRFFQTELDINAASAIPDKVKITDDFPKLTYMKDESQLPMDHDIEYAYNITFGQLSTAQQRILLFLRALIHHPDIVILDEPFSGLTASQVEKCIHFLEKGDSPLKPSSTPTSHIPRFHGLTEDQALVFISHLKEEIPATVRHYIRLPSDAGDETEALDLRIGSLQKTSVLSNPEVWDLVWSPPSHFQQHAIPLKGQDGSSDAKSYDWWSI